MGKQGGAKGRGRGPAKRQTDLTGFAKKVLKSDEGQTAGEAARLKGNNAALQRATSSEIADAPDAQQTPVKKVFSEPLMTDTEIEGNTQVPGPAACPSPTPATSPSPTKTISSACATIFPPTPRTAPPTPQTAPGTPCALAKPPAADAAALQQAEAQVGKLMDGQQVNVADLKVISAQAMEALINKAVGARQDVLKPGDDAPPGMDMSGLSKTMSEKFGLMKKAMEDGACPSGGRLGKAFERACADSEALAAEYAAAQGSKHKKAIRTNWLATEYEKIVKTRTKTESHTELDSIMGKYKPWPILLKDEGYDFEAALNYVTSAIELQKNGELANGRAPWMKWNKMSKRVRWLHLDETVGDINKATNKLTTTESTNERSLSKPNPVASASPSAGGAAGGSGGATPPPKPNNPPKPQTPKDPKTIKIDKGFGTLRALKTKGNKAAQQCSDLLQTIATNESWACVNNPYDTRGLKEASAELEQFKTSTAFWSLWMVEDNLGPVAKKKFTTENLIEEMNSIPKLEDLIKKLEGACKKIKNIHAVKSGE